LQDEAILADDNGVAGIVPAGNARDVIEGAGKIVDDLAFSFVTPLRTNNHDGLHSVCLSHPSLRSFLEENFRRESYEIDRNNILRRRRTQRKPSSQSLTLFKRHLQLRMRRCHVDIPRILSISRETFSWQFLGR